jgi:hypothetical protein
MTKRDRFRRTLQGDAEIDAARGDEVDYSIDWQRQLISGEGLASAEWTVPTGLTRIADGLSGEISTIWIRHDELGRHLVTAQAHTTEGRVLRRSFGLIVRDHLS